MSEDPSFSPEQCWRDEALACVNGAGFGDMGNTQDEDHWVITGERPTNDERHFNILERIVGALRRAAAKGLP